MFARALEGTRTITSQEGLGGINACAGTRDISSDTPDGGTTFIDTWGGLIGDGGTKV